MSTDKRKSKGKAGTKFNWIPVASVVIVLMVLVVIYLNLKQNIGNDKFEDKLKAWNALEQVDLNCSERPPIYFKQGLLDGKLYQGNRIGDTPVFIYFDDDNETIKLQPTEALECLAEGASQINATEIHIFVGVPRPEGATLDAGGNTQLRTLEGKTVYIVYIYPSFIWEHSDETSFFNFLSSVVVHEVWGHAALGEEKEVMPYSLGFAYACLRNGWAARLQECLDDVVKNNPLPDLEVELAPDPVQLFKPSPHVIGLLEKLISKGNILEYR